MGGFSQTTFGFFNTGVGSTPPPTDPAIVVVGAGANSTVRCGLSNTASGGRSTVFGYNNTASGVDSAVYGGTCHTAAGNFSFIGGGNINIAANVFATVVGGQLNTACQRGSFIGGGINNIVNTAANTIYGGSVIAGGVGNNTTGGTYDESLGCFTVAPTLCLAGQYSFIGGGFQNISGGCYSAVGGGTNNRSGGNHSFVGGGANNCVTNIRGAIAGGMTNLVAGTNAFVGAGNCNFSCALNSGIGSGFFNFANGISSFIGGGAYNNICNNTSSCLSFGAVISGGVGNNTTGGTWSLATCSFTVNPTICNAGQYSFIGGGFQNLATSCYTSIVGGEQNLASACFASIGGGRINTASGRSGTISGGDENIASGQWAAVGGGRLNYACASNSFIGGGFNNRVCTSGLCGGIIGASNTLNHACSYVMGVSLSSDEANTSFFNNIKTGGARFAYSAKTADYTIVQTDYTINVTANSPTITLPTAVGISGKVYVVKNTGAGTVTLATTSAQTIDGAATQSIAANTSLMVQSTNANWIII